ncbi:MAG: hypothetical protein JXA42_13180 [Anaerolineales bacterium]|nr:hypothetical protein [Anaerolineales bacterium]
MKKQPDNPDGADGNHDGIGNGQKFFFAIRIKRHYNPRPDYKGYFPFHHLQLWMWMYSFAARKHETNA